MISDNRLFYKLNICQRLLMKESDRETIRRFNVPTAQIAALFYLRKNDGCQLKDLSIELFQNKSAITTLVERMEKNGLIQKKNSEMDGRAFQIFLTDKGKTIADQAVLLVREFNSQLAEKFSPDEIKTVNRFFDSIMDRHTNFSDRKS